MKKWLPKILAYTVMGIFMVFIALPIGIVWNFVLIMDMIFRDIKRRYKSGIKEMNKDDKKREESHK